MQTFVLAQAVVEHAALSSVSTGIADARYQLGVFVESLDATRVLIGLGVVAVVMFFFWRK